MKQFIVFVCGFVLICSNLLFADDFYWSCGHKKYVTLQTDYALIQTEKISEKAAQTLYKLQADKIEFPKEYKQLSGGWSLLRVDAKQLRNQVINQQILLVYKDKRGKLVLPTRDIVVRLKEKIDDSSVKKLAQRHGVSVKKRFEGGAVPGDCVQVFSVWLGVQPASSSVHPFTPTDDHQFGGHFPSAHQRIVVGKVVGMMGKRKKHLHSDNNGEDAGSYNAPVPVDTIFEE